MTVSRPGLWRPRWGTRPKFRVSAVDVRGRLLSARALTPQARPERWAEDDRDGYDGTDIGFVSCCSVVWMREFQRGAVRLHILHHAAEEPVHGAWLTIELARHGYTISPGTLYPTLHRLEADGLLISEQTVVDGRTRRVYRATEAGRAALAEDRAALAELATELLPQHGPAGHDAHAD